MRSSRPGVDLTAIFTSVIMISDIFGSSKTAETLPFSFDNTVIRNCSATYCFCLLTMCCAIWSYGHKIE